MRAAFAVVSMSVVAAARPVGRGLRIGRNWLQLMKFCMVGGCGYVVNLAVYSLLLQHVGLPYALAAFCSFLVAVSNNYALNRAWTFAARRGNAAVQAVRYFAVSLGSLGGNLLVLTFLVTLGVDELPAQAAAIATMMPLSFILNKLWSFRTDRGPQLSAITARATGRRFGTPRSVSAEPRNGR